jgi:phage baseplate assembly protein gpV
MGTTSKVRTYLNYGVLSDVLPGLYLEFDDKPFTETEARKRIKDFKHGTIMRLDNSGMIYRINGKSRLHLVRGEPTQWALTPKTREAIKKYLDDHKEQENGGI